MSPDMSVKTAINTYQMYINGEFVEAGNKHLLDAINPCTEEIIAKFPKATVEDTRKAIKAARQAFDSGVWPNLSYQKRAKYLKKISEGIMERAMELIDIEARDTGKTIKQATFIDIPVAAQCFDYYSNVENFLADEEIKLQADAKSFIYREPIGVIAQNIPWNYPMIMAAWKLAPALAAGNCVVFKPSHLAPLSALELAKIIDKVGIPKGVVNIITGEGKIIGEELSKNEDVDMVAFTGSTEVGRSIMKDASGNIKKVCLELGGKSPNIVFADSDFDAAVGGSLSAIFMNTGQMCVAGSRLLVEDKIYDKFVSQIIERTKKLKIGNNLDHSTDIGPVISKEQKAAILRCIEIGKEEGAKLLYGGNAVSVNGKGYFIEPTIFEGNNKMSIAQEEIFGPVLCIIKFSGVEEAVKIANDTKYGLAAMIWSKDLEKANRVAEKLRCGQIWINTYGFFHNEAPFGGYKQSGIGRELGKEGLLEYTELKHVNTDQTAGGKSLSSQWFS